ncbi:MAG: 3-hydroxyacyl-CoA dehydrogenase NAD-binding domain-containing protein [Gemmatimonadota bacterium]|nr:3-hydroxyacyl-CoA dehydrogenase NAD-binding domain-containing protein [Gemmatimonadota bacterium]
MISFDNIAIMGSRKKAQQIAETVSSSGIEVLLFNVKEESGQRALKGIEESIDRAIKRWGMTESDKRAILGRITTTNKVEDLAGQTVFIEACGTDMEKKRHWLGEVGRCCKKPELYITHISTLSVTEIAADSSLEKKVIGMHFLEPVPKIPVVELVRAVHTDDETVENAREFAKRLGKTSVEVFEYPGYITTRIVLPMLNEAIYILQEGLATAEDIDTAIKLGFNLPMGPLRMADTFGLDEIQRRMDNMFHELGELKYRPCPLLKKMVRAGKLGRKSGEGFFKYDTKDEYA